MDEKELLETILAAEILILAKCLEINGDIAGLGGANHQEEAIAAIKRSRQALIQKLQSVF